MASGHEIWRKGHTKIYVVDADNKISIHKQIQTCLLDWIEIEVIESNSFLHKFLCNDERLSS